MAMNTLGLLFLLNLLAFGLNHEFKVKYEMVDDFGPRAEEWFERSHGIVRRATKQGNSSIPTADPTKSALNTTATTGSNSRLTEPATPTARSSTTSPQKSSVTPSPTSNKPTSSINRPSPSSNKPTSGTNRPNTTNNISIIEDNHRYYKSQYYDAGEQWWFDLEDGGNAKIHAGLSKNLQYSDTIDTSFKFPYYGHLIDKVTITNKGFVFLGEKLHKFNAPMQYVAPLMANFGPHLYENTTIRYVDTGDRFTTEWANIRLLKNQTAAGEFSFQCSIFKNGTIVFAYKKIPIPVSEIKNNTFFVRVGLSDSYVFHHDRFFVINGKVYGIRFVVYYRYHQVKLPWSSVKSGSAFVITPLLNCVFYKTCNSCVQSKTAFSCEWCPKLNRCSDGFDRHRQEWLINRCHKNSKTTCSALTTPKFVPTSKVNIVIPKSTKSEGGKEANKHHESSIDDSGIAILVVLCVGIVLVLICWYVYAYRHPQSTSGMFWIKYGNPTKWCRNSNGETTSSTGGNVSFKSMSEERAA